MANKLPAYVIKGVTLAAGDAGNRIGQCNEITIPVMGKTMEDFRNAGMIKPRQIMMGFEATTTSFRETSFDPDMIELFGVGKGSPIIAYGYMESEDGTQHAARFEMECDVTQIDAGSWADAQKAEIGYDLTVHSGVLFIDDEEIIAFDDFSYRVRGQEQMAGRRAALRLD